MVTQSSSNIKTAASGKVLQGQGVGTANDFSTATYPSTATTTGQILRADGTNWVGTTATYPNTAGTSGNVLTSDGTNWTSAAATGGSGATLLTGTLTSAQIKALHATPIQVVAAPGAGKVILVHSSFASFNYGGSNVFIAGAGQTIILTYGTTIGSASLISNASLTAGSSNFNSAPSAATITTAAFSSVTNTAINAWNSVATEISGNAANNNTVTYTILYSIATMP